MGMFDSIFIEMVCPFCGELSRVEAQTKELEKCLSEYEKGDYISDKYNYLDCIAYCSFTPCKEKHRMNRVIFYVRIYLEKGIVSGVCNTHIFKDENELINQDYGKQT